MNIREKKIMKDPISDISHTYNERAKRSFRDEGIDTIKMSSKGKSYIKIKDRQFLMRTFNEERYRTNT